MLKEGLSDVVFFQHGNVGDLGSFPSVERDVAGPVIRQLDICDCAKEGRDEFLLPHPHRWFGFFDGPILAG